MSALVQFASHGRAGTPPRLRGGNPCPGHPRLGYGAKDVDARTKSGHDVVFGLAPKNALAVLVRELRVSLCLWLALAAGFFLGFELLQLALLILRFQTFPNYLTAYDWPGNIARIVRMTPSVADMVSIALDEWLIEIGSMDFAYGHGIAEWSFVLVPAKAAVALVVALLLAANVVLLRALRKACPLPVRLGASIIAAGGALIAGAATMTMTWVVCCAAPSWVVGLAVLGVGVATAFALQPIGGWLSLAGIVLLAATATALARRLPGSRREAAAAIALPGELARAPS
jgi:hypothetical protein